MTRQTNDNGDHHLDQGPIFIGGPDRSGKTYMRLMLSSHPNLVLSRRTNMWTYFFDQFGPLDRAINFERCLEAMLQHEHVRSLEPDADRIRHEFWQGPPTYAHLFALIHQHYAERQAKLRWGDQTELIERCAGAIFAAYPNARMIHMIRDPRDGYEAAIARRPQNKGKVGYATAKWLYSVALARQNQQNYPYQYKVVRYESMVSQPEETLHDVCEFLGEAYVLAMLTMESVPRFRRRRHIHIKPGESPLSKEFIGRYRAGLSNYEIAFIQKYAGQYMRHYDYTLEAFQFTISEKARFYLDWGIGAARMLGWRALKIYLRPILHASVAK